MIGLEHICKVYDIKHVDLAEKLEIKKQNINFWVTEKRNIPKKYLPKLAEIFDLPEEYFQKELTNEDKLKIEKKRLNNQWNKVAS